MEAIGPYALPDQLPHADHDRWNEPPIGPDYARAARAAILQLAQDLDLRRLERDPEEHHREGDIGTLTFLPRERCLPSSPAKAGDPVNTTLAGDYWMPRLRGA